MTGDYLTSCLVHLFFFFSTTQPYFYSCGLVEKWIKQSNNNRKHSILVNTNKYKGLELQEFTFSLQKIDKQQQKRNKVFEFVWIPNVKQSTAFSYTCRKHYEKLLEERLWREAANVPAAIYSMEIPMPTQLNTCTHAYSYSCSAAPWEVTNTDESEGPPQLIGWFGTAANSRCLVKITGQAYSDNSLQYCSQLPSICGSKTSFNTKHTVFPD